MRAPVALAILALLAAGCLHNAAGPTPTPTVTGAPANGFRVTCLLVDENRTPLHEGTCTWRFGSLGASASIDGNGTAARMVPAGLVGTLTGEAPGRVGQQAHLRIDGPKSVRFPLPVLPPGAKPGTIAPAPGDAVTDPGNGTESVAPVPVRPRTWLPAVAVVGSGSGGEPQVVVAPDGTVYYSPLSTIYVSTDAGATFHDITPRLPNAGPVSASDTAISVAPDGAVWFTDDWPYAGSTQACASSDRGSTWTCDIAALPGATDRMWISGLSASEGYLETGQALQQPNWFHSTTGSQTYAPFAAGVIGQYGNMVYDEVHHAVWQITGGATQSIARVDTAGPMVAFDSTPVPGTASISWLAVSNGTLWTTGEKDGRTIVARSTDEGHTWRQSTVSIEPKMSAFSYVAAQGQRAAVVYYGSDKPGDPDNNHGHWSLYVAETDNALDDQPTWVETRLVDAIHDGNLCIGLNCEKTGGDANARMAGDLIGIAMDRDGNAYLAYVRDAKDSFPDEFMRQVAT